MLINPRFKQHPGAFFWQSSLVFVMMLVILFVFGHLAMVDMVGAIGVSSLAATIFIAFALPDLPVAQPKRMVGSYLVGIAIGTLCLLLLQEIALKPDWINLLRAHQVLASVGVSFVVFLTSVTGLEHPPAVGLTFGIIIDDWDFVSLAVVLLSVTLVAVLHELLKPWLYPLVHHEPDEND